jgi:hypothetical protein
MSDPIGTSKKRVIYVKFTVDHKIKKAELNKAIAGGMKRAGLERVTQQQRQEVIADVYYHLTRHFARGKTLTGKLSSLAYAIAYRVAVDTYRRPGQYAKRRSGGDVTLATPAAGFDTTTENAEAGLLRYAANTLMARQLAKGIKNISETDWEALLGMIKRDAPLPRGTAVEIKAANLIAQHEKRARDRLCKAVERDGAQER